MIGITLSFSFVTDTQVKARIDALKTQCGTLQAALDKYGIRKRLSHRQPPPESTLPLDISQLAPAKQAQLATALLKSLSVIDKSTCIKAALQDLNIDDTDYLANMVFFELALKKDINTYPTDFAKLSSDAMARLQAKNKPNLMHKFARCIAESRPGSDEPLMPIDRMPFGLIQYQIEFFSCTNISQVSHFCTLCMSNSFCAIGDLSVDLQSFTSIIHHTDFNFFFFSYSYTSTSCKITSYLSFIDSILVPWHQIEQSVDAAVRCQREWLI